VNQTLVIMFDGRAARVIVPAALPVSDLMKGRSPEEGADLLPRLFGICGAAQGLAMRLSLGLPVTDLHHKALRREMLRDHLAKLCLRWPALLGLSPIPFPSGWANSADISKVLFGGPAPEGHTGFKAWLDGGRGVAPVISAIANAFGNGAAATNLPLADPDRAPGQTPVENSAAGRQARHPVMRSIEASKGRGPLWRATGRLFDAVDCAADHEMATTVLPDRTALVPTARGYYAVRALTQGGLISEFERWTPTDHLCVPDGVLEQSLASLAPATPARIALLADILDPCVPVTVREVANA
jgi:hypothetical protein